MRDNEEREKAVRRLNATLVDLASTAKRVNNARSELGTAESEHDKATRAYCSARSRLLKLCPKITSGEPVGAPGALEPAEKDDHTYPVDTVGAAPA